jgi:hypothetical protein
MQERTRDEETYQKLWAIWERVLEEGAERGDADPVAGIEGIDDHAVISVCQDITQSWYDAMVAGEIGEDGQAVLTMAHFASLVSCGFSMGVQAHKELCGE